MVSISNEHDPFWLAFINIRSNATDGYHLYFAFQDEGYLFDVTRVDGLPFHQQTLDIKYHNVIARRKKGRRTK